MNNTRRKELAKAIDLMEQAMEIINIIKDEEQDGFDNLPEGFQQGEKGEKIEENVSTLEDAISSLEESIDNLNTASE